MDEGEIVAKMRARVAQCRRLAAATTDPRAASILRAMAEEGEADIRRILEEGGGAG
jgi:hypothetical protein